MVVVLLWMLVRVASHHYKYCKLGLGECFGRFGWLADAFVCVVGVLLGGMIPCHLWLAAGRKWMILHLQNLEVCL